MQWLVVRVANSILTTVCSKQANLSKLLIYVVLSPRLEWKTTSNRLILEQLSHRLYDLLLVLLYMPNYCAKPSETLIITIVTHRCTCTCIHLLGVQYKRLSSEVIYTIFLVLPCWQWTKMIIRTNLQLCWITLFGRNTEGEKHLNGFR